VTPRNRDGAIRFLRSPAAGLDLLQCLRQIARAKKPLPNDRLLADLLEVGILTTVERDRASAGPLRVRKAASLGVKLFLPVSGGASLLEQLAIQFRDHERTISGCRVGRKMFFANCSRVETLRSLHAEVRAECESCATYADVVIGRAVALCARWPGPSSFWSEDEKGCLEMAIVDTLEQSDTVLAWTPGDRAAKPTARALGTRSYVVGDIHTDRVARNLFCSRAIHRTADLSVREHEWQPWCVSSARTSQVSELKCRMECVERYIATDFVPGEETTVLGSWSSLGSRAVDPVKVSLIVTKDLREVRGGPTVWTYCSPMSSKKSLLVPLQVVSLRALSQDLRLPLAKSSTVGVATHNKFASAKENAILEVFERNALLECWLSQRPPSQIDQRSLGREGNALAAAAKCLGYEVVLLDVSNRGLPVVLSLAFSREGGFTSYAKGSASAEEPQRAASAALLELHRMLHFNPRTGFIVPEIHEIWTTWDHVAYHSHPPRFRKLREWATGGRTKAIDEMCARTITEVVAELDAEPLICELAKETEACTVRAIIPGVVPLAYGPLRKDALSAGSEPGGYGFDVDWSRLPEVIVHPFG
jgi:thiazole/oxazole-forming peptide maturase SagD family component